MYNYKNPNSRQKPAIAAMHDPHSLVRFGADKIRFGPIR